MKSIKKRRLPEFAENFTAAVLIAGWGAAFSGLAPAIAAIFSRLALLPALLSIGAVAIGITLLSAVCGRFYCACICPLGIIQDLLRQLIFRKNTPGAGNRKLRMAVSGWALGMWIAGSAAGVLWLDPYSNFGRIAGAATLFAVISGIILAAALFFRPRWFCNYLCPAGTLLEAVAHYPVLRLEFNEKCLKCRLCAKNCPAGCIDTGKWQIDQSRCLRCLKCMSLCPAAECGISFRKIRRNDVNLNRREFLVNSGIFLAAAAAGSAVTGSGIIKLFPSDGEVPILPPGAGSLQDFAAKCSGCQLCVKNCPARIIVPDGSGRVSLDLKRGSCDFNCNRCSQICPAGAIRKSTLPEKQKLRIAAVSVNPSRCVGCGECENICPVRAVSFPQDIPVFDASRCIGCGKCVNLCPTNAIGISGIPRQIRLK